MNAKKVLLVILAVVLICAISVTGTLAYLSEKSGEVKNTFVAAGGGSLLKATGSITLNEAPAVPDPNTGKYSLDHSVARVTQNSYSVIPGTTVPKDPKITITGKNEVPAYLFVEIVDETGANITWTPAAGWIELTGAQPTQTGGKVYVWQDILTADAVVPVLAGDEITIANVEELGLAASGSTMKFYAFLAQTVVGESTYQTQVFNDCL